MTALLKEVPLKSQQNGTSGANNNGEDDDDDDDEESSDDDLAIYSQSNSYKYGEEGRETQRDRGRRRETERTSFLSSSFSSLFSLSS